MHLKSIKLRGFKSFPDPVELRLEPGVAVVVGPNGSGKSNVADALLWASGSQSPRELRAERADDVLFAGSKARPPAASCEVELVFDNADGALAGLDFAEVSVARRLHRGGEGQYLVNRAGVRRLDLVELLADAGLGGGLRAVVSQGRVEEILASRPAERRALVEEAAGLGRYKLRRHRAELKLARVRAQAERAADVEREVRARLRPLALQATAAERAARLGAEVASVRARIAELDVEEGEARVAEAEDSRLAASLARRRIDAELDEALAARDSAEEELADAAGGRERATAALYRLRSAAERLELRRESAAALERRFCAALDAASAAPSGAALLAAEQAARVALDAREAARGRAREAFGRLAAAERGLAAKAERRLTRASAARQAGERDAAALAAARERLYAVRAAGERIALRREASAALAGRLGDELGAARSFRGDELRAAAEEASAAARWAARERDAVVERARLARERLNALDRALAAQEGIPPAARALAEAGERLALDLVDIEPGTERAVAAALGPRASAVVAADARKALDLARRAARSGLGSLRVIVGRDPATLVRELPVVPFDELLAAKGPAVTLEGFGYDPDRGELWFAGEAAETVQLELRARRTALAAEAERLGRAARQAETEAVQARGTERKAEAALAAVPPQLRRLPDPAVAEELASAADRLDAMLLAAARTASGFTTRLADKATAGPPLGKLVEAESAARRDAHEAATRAEAATSELARLDGAEAAPAGNVEGLRVAAVDARSALDAAAAAVSRAGAEAARLREAVRRGDPAALACGREAAGRLGAALAGAASAAEAVEGPLRAQADAGSRRAGELAADLRRLAEREVELRRTAGEASERAAAADVALASANAALAEAQRRREEAGAEPAAGDDREALAARAAQLERRRESIGEVNPLAQAEYERERERLDDLREQREDIERSLQELERLRADLTETVELRFEQTFDAIAATFAEVAGTLFPGGEGRLTLSEPAEDEESGIEVELRPAGKRITRLSLLSGGEKALGAIAFLFALFLARPCPFYLLDEVEAALDDANIGRFVALLRRYADRAQFIVVTHQKRTMEAADLLYGVTMGADGVSQVVSRRMPPRETAAA